MTVTVKKIEKIILSQIFHNPLVKVAATNTYVHFHNLYVVYALINPVEPKTFNFNKFVGNLDVLELLDDNSILRCDCTVFPFADKYYNHITTGNLKVTDSYKLRKGRKL